MIIGPLPQVQVSFKESDLFLKYALRENIRKNNVFDPSF